MDFVFEPITYVCCMGRSRIHGEWQSENYRVSEDGPEATIETGRDSPSKKSKYYNGNSDDGDINTLRMRLVNGRLSLYILYILLFKRRSCLQTSSSQTGNPQIAKISSFSRNKVVPERKSSEEARGTPPCIGIRVDAYHRFNCIFQDIRGGDRSKNWQNYFCRHYKVSSHI